MIAVIWRAATKDESLERRLYDHSGTFRGEFKMTGIPENRKAGTYGMERLRETEAHPFGFGPQGCRFPRLGAWYYTRSGWGSAEHYRSYRPSLRPAIALTASLTSIDGLPSYGSR